ncbi:GNAT family N-acetyltransferase [Paenibacillus sp. FSL K6-1230]|uniref:GNAT family N-acetyltransferase n=1 Tax=Paenibacillus sp. FSL K6-1230 TaxID=2921603 RepID=UPI0030F6287A
MQLQLVRPSLKWQEGYLRFYENWVASGERMVPWVIARNPEDFEEMLALLCGDEQAGEQEGRVSNSTYWLVNPQQHVLGAVNIRHELGPGMLNRGGHIGYGLCPSARGKGYASEMLRLALIEGAKLGLEKVLLTCDDTNAASFHTIEGQGGQRDSDFREDNGNLVRRYWIDLREQNLREQKGYDPAQVNLSVQNGHFPDHEVQIRAYASEEDLHYVIEAHARIYAEEYRYDDSFTAFVKQTVSEFDRHHDPAREGMWLLEMEGRPQGCIGIIKAASEGDCAQLRWMLVEPEARGNGYGRILMEHALQFCRKAGWEKVILWTNAELIGARALYTACGFQLVETREQLLSGRLLTEERWLLSL